MLINLSDSGVFSSMEQLIRWDLTMRIVRLEQHLGDVVCLRGPSYDVSVATTFAEAAKGTVEAHLGLLQGWKN